MKCFSRNFYTSMLHLGEKKPLARYGNDKSINSHSPLEPVTIMQLRCATVVAIIVLCFYTTANANNIIKILAKVSYFNHYLTETHLAEDINNWKYIYEVIKS